MATQHELEHYEATEDRISSASCTPCGHLSERCRYLRMWISRYG